MSRCPYAVSVLRSSACRVSPLITADWCLAISVRVSAIVELAMVPGISVELVERVEVRDGTTGGAHGHREATRERVDGCRGRYTREETAGRT